METPMEIFKSEDGKVQRRASIEELERDLRDLEDDNDDFGIIQA